MSDNSQNILFNNERPKRNLLVKLTSVAVVLVFFFGIFAVMEQNLSDVIFFLCYTGSVLLLIANFRDELGFIVLTGTGEKFNRALLPYYLVVLFFMVMPILIKHTFNQMALINNEVMISTLLCSILFTVAIVNRNRNFSLPRFSNNVYKAGIAVLGLLLGYGFSLEFNCFEPIDSHKVYAISITNRYIVTGHDKGGTYHVPHYMIENWP
jgi:hypothetical protein